MPERDVEITGMVLPEHAAAEAGAYVNSGLISPFPPRRRPGPGMGGTTASGCGRAPPRCLDDPTDQVGVAFCCTCVPVVAIKP